jgi:AraC family L-rhamnose operon regulatory protein RhaS
MEYFTEGKEFFAGFRLPLVYSESARIPASDDGYCGIVCAERGLLRVDTGVSRSYLQAPVAVLLRPRHTVREIAVSEGQAHSCIFRPGAVNTTVPVTDMIEIPDLPEYFFFRPFVTIGETGYVAMPLPPGVYGTLARLCNRLDELLNGSQSPFWPCMSRSYFIEMLILIERNGYLPSSERSFALPPEAGSLGSALEYIHTHYSEPVSLDSLSSALATNRTTLNRRFNETCGMSALAYLNTVRIELASSLLRNTELSIAEIARRTGFSDESYFSRSFRKANGVSPGTYRKSFPNPYA